MFSKGDLFFLNDKGVNLFRYVNGKNGFIIRGPYLLVDCKSPNQEYYGYDIIINARLFIEIPEKFLLRVIKNEENTE